MARKGRIQFSLLVVFWLMTLVASSLTAFGVLGLFVALVVGLFWGYVYPGPNRLKRVLQAFLLLLLTPFFLPAVRTAREAARRAQCTNNVKNILLCLLNYESINGHFPPSFTTDENGQPLHSWRVLILPYLGYDSLYSQIRLDEPWDSPHNQKLIPLIPFEYQCPSHEDSELGHCHYAAILGEDTGWRPETGVRLSEFSVGRRNTLLVCETLHGIPWTKPEDVTPEEFVSKGRASLSQQPFAGHLLDGNYVTTGCRIQLGFADGHVESMDAPADADLLRRLASRHDAFSIPSHFDAIFQRRTKWGEIVGTVSFLVLCLLPPLWIRQQEPVKA